MDFFNVLRQGVSFANSDKSKKVHFKAKQLALKEEKSNLDFFGDAPVDKEAAEAKKAKRKQFKAEENTISESAQQTEDRMNVLRKEHKIQVSGLNKTPNLLEKFDDLTKVGCPQWLQSAVHFCNFPGVQPIQMQAIPVLLENHHVLANAPTGSGKTMAFLIPMLAKLNKPGKGLARGLVIDPTRELAVQTLREFDRLTKAKKFKGRFLDKISSVGQGLTNLDLAIATPMRLCQLLKDGKISLDDTRHLVLDEVDKLLDLGFAPQIDEILSYCTIEQTQIIMFSATIAPVVVELAESVLTNPVRISIGRENSSSADINQELVFVGPETAKLQALRQIVREGRIVPPTLMFVQSKDRAQALFNELVFDGLNVDVIHAERTRAQRDRSIAAFRAGQIWILICTDLMARGVDFKGVELVINYDMPQTSATYIHRIGRTGRAGRKGQAITFFSLDDFDYLKTVVNVMVASGCEVPDFLRKMKNTARKLKRKGDYKPVERKRINTAPTKILFGAQKDTPDLTDGQKKRKAKAWSKNKAKKTEFADKVGKKTKKD